jgi:HEAT repeat protein
MLTNSHLAQLKASSEFLRMTHDESPARRERALEALGVIRVAGSLAIHASLKALDDPVLEVRLAAIRTLGERGGTGTNVVRALTTCLKDDSASIRDAAAQALEKLHVQGTN